MESQPSIKATIDIIPADVRDKLWPQEASTEVQSGRKQEGKFIELPGAEMGKVVVRFPPEASG